MLVRLAGAQGILMRLVLVEALGVWMVLVGALRVLMVLVEALRVEIGLVAPAPNETMLSAPPADEAPNQRLGGKKNPLPKLRSAILSERRHNLRPHGNSELIWSSQHSNMRGKKSYLLENGVLVLKFDLDAVL